MHNLPCSSTLPTDAFSLPAIPIFMNHLSIPRTMRTSIDPRTMFAPQPPEPAIHVTPGPQGRWELTEGILTWSWHRAHHRTTILAQIDPTLLPKRLSRDPFTAPWDALPCAYCGGPTLLQRPATLSPLTFAQWQRTTDAWIPRTAAEWTDPENEVIACGLCHRAKGDQLLWHPDPRWVDTAPKRWNRGISQGWIQPRPVYTNLIPSPVPASSHHRTSRPLDDAQPPLLKIPLPRIWVDPDAPFPRDEAPVLHVEAFAQPQAGWLQTRWRLTAGLALWRSHRALKTPTVIAIVDAVHLPLPFPGTRVHEVPRNPEAIIPCAYCGGPTWAHAPTTMPAEAFQQHRRTIDHWIPRAAGGPNLQANRVIACHRCNLHKADRLTWQPPPHWIQEAIQQWDRAHQAGWIPSMAPSPFALDTLFLLAQ